MRTEHTWVPHPLDTPPLPPPTPARGRYPSQKVSGTRDAHLIPQKGYWTRPPPLSPWTDRQSRGKTHNLRCFLEDATNVKNNYTVFVLKTSMIDFHSWLIGCWWCTTLKRRTRARISGPFTKVGTGRERLIRTRLIRSST